MRTFHEWLEQADLRRLLKDPEDLLARSVPHEDGTTGRFRRLVLRRLGDLALLVLDLRLAGGRADSFVGCPAVGSPDRKTVERAAGGVRRLAREYGRSLGDPVLLRRIEMALANDEEGR